MFTDTMFCCADDATAYTRSSPAMMSDVYPPMHGAVPPHVAASITSENTCTAMILEPLATLEKVCPALSPLPAAMPATWVPCRHESSAHGTADPEPSCSSRPLGQSVCAMPGSV